MRVLELTGLSRECTGLRILVAAVQILIAVRRENGLARLVADAVFPTDAAA
jgi:hypothetical protein